MSLIYRFSFFLIFLFIACSSATEETPTTTVDGQVEVNQFKTMLAKTKNAQLVDVRTPDEYAEGHLENAQNINFNDVNFEQQIGQLDKSKPVFVYCQVGGRSGKAYKKMKNLGFSTVYDMAGGYNSWSKN